MHPNRLPGTGALMLAGGAALIFGAGPALSQGTGLPAENWAKTAACARFERGDERLACLDAVLRASGLLDPVRELAQQRESFGQQPRPTPRSAPPIPASPPKSAAATPVPTPVPPAAPVELQEIATTISRAFDPGNRLMVIVTQDGQVWQQSESRDLGLPPRAGTSFMVEKGTLGGFICRIAKGRSFRCRRQG